MSAEYNFTCPLCPHPDVEKPEDYYGKVSFEEFEDRRQTVTDAELMDFDSLRAGAEVRVEDGRLVVTADCYCTKCGASCAIKFSKKIEAAERIPDIEEKQE